MCANSVLVKLMFLKQGDQIHKLELELKHVNQECQSLKLSQMQRRGTCDERQDQVGERGGPGQAPAAEPVRCMLQSPTRAGPARGVSRRAPPSWSGTYQAQD